MAAVGVGIPGYVQLSPVFSLELKMLTTDYENEHGLRQTVGIKIPIDAVEVEEFQSTRP
jgi:hypothetical protein